MKACLGILPLNQIWECQLTGGRGGWREDHVLAVEKIVEGESFPVLHRYLSSDDDSTIGTGDGRHCFSKVIIAFLLREALNHHSPFTKASATVASLCKPEAAGPLPSVKWNKGPRSVQSSNQKLAKLPDPTSHETKGLANTLNLQSYFHIQLSPRRGSSSQKLSDPILFLLIHETHNDPPAANKSQMSFSVSTWFQSANFLSPSARKVEALRQQQRRTCSLLFVKSLADLERLYCK